MKKETKETVNATASYISDVAIDCCRAYNKLAFLSAVVSIGAWGIKTLTKKEGGEKTTEK